MTGPLGLCNPSGPRQPVQGGPAGFRVARLHREGSLPQRSRGIFHSQGFRDLPRRARRNGCPKSQNITLLLPSGEPVRRASWPQQLWGAPQPYRLTVNWRPPRGHPRALALRAPKLTLKACTPRMDVAVRNSDTFYGGDDVSLAETPSAVREDDIPHHGTTLPPAT
jgi:hypothetical protein